MTNEYGARAKQKSTVVPTDPSVAHRPHGRILVFERVLRFVVQTVRMTIDNLKVFKIPFYPLPVGQIS